MISYSTLLLLCKEFTRDAHPQCCCALLQLVLGNFIDADKRIKGIQIGDHEINLVDIADDITIFLRDITCLNRIQKILKLYEEASNSKNNFSESQALRTGAYKNKTDKPGKIPWS